ncbi:MAG: hypothetical protein K6G23_10595, partial [Lachnospiraceae bacterium]|nr:hypothetical protein [Lachnospiraceae bacterium]
MGYSVTSEYAALALAATMLFIMAYSRPRKTKIYYYDFFGMAASIVAILCEVQIVYLAKFPAWVDLPYRINSLIWIYLVFHLLVLLCMVNYVNSFSLSGEGQQSLQRIESWAIVILYVASALIVQFTTGFYEQKILGCNLEWFIRFHTGWGLIVCTLIFVTAIICRNNLSRIVKIDIMLFLPIIIVMLFLQQMSRLSLFSSFCYVLPFTVCYIMFHSNPYDEQTGCQNYYSFAAKIQSILRHHTHYAVATLHYPELDQPFDKERRAKINHAISATCRNMEKLDRKVRIYRTASDMFTVMKTLMPNEHSAEDFLNDIAAAGKYLLSLTDDLHYGHMIGFNSQITDMDANLMEGFNDYLHRTYITEAKTYQVHIATEQDYDDYFEVHTLFRELKDIYT